MNRNRSDSTNSRSEDAASSEEAERVPTAREVLEELFQLLEDYAPTWYTEQHHNRAVAALLQSVKEH